MSLKLAMELYFRAKEDGGATVWRSGDVVQNTTGYVVGGFAPSLEFRPGRVVEDVEKVAEWVDHNYSVSYGSWEDDGILYFDVVRLYDSFNDAYEDGLKNNQIAIWSIAERREIRLEQEQKEEGGESRV